MLSQNLVTATAAPCPRIKFRLAGGAQPLMLVPVQVNDWGPYAFILDTGAGTTLLTPRLAQSLGIRSPGSRQGQTAGGAVDVSLVVLDSLSLGEGPAAVRDLDVLISEFLEMLSQAVGVRLDGILGHNFLRNFRVVMDYPSNLLSLLPYDQPAAGQTDLA